MLPESIEIDLSLNMKGIGERYTKKSKKDFSEVCFL